MHSRNVLSWHFFFTPKIYFINLQNNSAQSLEHKFEYQKHFVFKYWKKKHIK